MRTGAACAAVRDDFHSWLSLAREVEPLFGPMADEPGFREALRQALDEGRAFCVRAGGPGSTLCGGVIVSLEANEILWLAVCGAYRGMGCGKALLSAAVGALDAAREVTVQTFDESVPEGAAARRLYLRAGFADRAAAGANPAGVPTVIMVRPPAETGGGRRMQDGSS